MSSQHQPRHRRRRSSARLLAGATAALISFGLFTAGAAAAPCRDCPDKEGPGPDRPTIDPTPTTRPPAPTATTQPPSPPPVVRTGPCIPTPADAPLAQVRVSCSADGTIAVSLESFVTPIINTVGSVLRVFEWQQHTGLFGWGGPGWVEVPAPAEDARISNRHIDVQAGGVTYYETFYQQCEGLQTPYINPNPFGPPQFQCMTWGFQVGVGTGGGMATPIFELIGRALGHQPGSPGPSANFDVAAGKHVFSSGRVVINGELIAVGPTFA